MGIPPSCGVCHDMTYSSGEDCSSVGCTDNERTTEGPPTSNDNIKVKEKFITRLKCRSMFPSVLQ